MATIDLRPIPAHETRALRQRVLRPHQRPEELVYPGDDAPDTLHLAVYVNGEQVGVASLYREPMPGESDPRVWRLRGMAVTPALQRGGHGRALLEACIAHAKGRGGTRLWCNARTTAAGFYTRLGFEVQGAEFELPGIGPHYVMWRAL
jgi:GNAT superfamily N-acetyltransferase